MKNLTQINEDSLVELTKFLNSGYKVLLEADLVSLLFHCYIITDNSLLNKIHIETRIINIKKKRIDFVIGNISFKDKRPSIIPELLIEAKVFTEGFTSSQLSKRFSDLKDDILKISEMELQIPRFILIYDFYQYLNNQKIEELISFRNSTDKDIEIILISRRNQLFEKTIY